MSEILYPEYVSLVATVFVNSELNVILGKQFAKRYPGFYRPPGGKVERTDASLREAVMREFLEETGISFRDLGGIDQIHKIYSVGDRNVVVTLFGVHFDANMTIPGIIEFLDKKHKSCKYPNEMMDIVAIPVYDLMTNPETRYSIAPDFRAEITIGDTAEAFAKFVGKSY